MKRTLLLLLALIFAFSLCSCTESYEKADEYARLFTEAGVTVKKDVRYLNRFFAEIQNPKRAKYMTVTLTLSTDKLEEDYEYCLSIGAELVRDGVISGGMIPKVNCCIEAIRRGVKKVFIIDGRIPHSILIEVLTDAGIGTMFVSGNHI